MRTKIPFGVTVMIAVGVLAIWLGLSEADPLIVAVLAMTLGPCLVMGLIFWHVVMPKIKTPTAADLPQAPDPATLTETTTTQPYDPKPGELWEHMATGNKYVVLYVTNTGHKSDKHPEDVVYRSFNSDAVWSRPLTSWRNRFVRRATGPFPRNGA